MPIEIKTEKRISGTGKRGRRILGVKVLRKEDLPELYTGNYEKRPVVFQHQNSLVRIMYKQSKTVPTEIRDMYENCFYTEEDFQAMKEKIYQAGEHLRDVNRFLRKERESWNGVETIVI